jgi:hypothetical protein
MALPSQPDVAYQFVRTLVDCGYEWVLVQEHTVVSVGRLRASRRRRRAERAWPGWVRRWACMNEFEG